MVSGIVIGILKEQHSDHIILTDSSRIQLPEGMALERFPSGCRVTVLYSRNDATEMVLQSIARTVTSSMRHIPKFDPSPSGEPGTAVAPW